MHTFVITYKAINRQVSQRRVQATDVEDAIVMGTEFGDVREVSQVMATTVTTHELVRL
jgi:hypothetical protein